MSRAVYVILSVVVVTGLLLVVMFQQETLSRLRGELAAQPRTEPSAREVTIRPEATQTLSDPASTNDRLSELLRLRSEVTRLRNEKAERVADSRGEVPVVKPMEEADLHQIISSNKLAFAGYATPRDAITSLLWAFRTANGEAVFASFTPEVQSKMTNNTLIPIDAKELSKEITGSNPMKSIPTLTILKQVPVSENEMNVYVYGEGSERVDKINLKRINGEWRFTSFGD